MLISEHVRDYHEVISHLGVSGCGIFAYSTGVATAYAFALAYPEIVSKVVALNAVPPILKRKDASELNAGFRAGALVALFAPTSLRLLCNLAAKKFSNEGKNLGKPLLFPDYDYESAESEDVLEASRRNSQEAIKNGGEAYWREISYCTTDWAASAPMSNHLPAVTLVRSQDSPFVQQMAQAKFAQRINAKNICVPSIIPFLTGQLDTVLKEF